MQGPSRVTENSEPAVWFPAVRARTGADVFTERLAAGLAKRGIRTDITWLPLRAEYAPWTVPVPTPPEWATVAHINSWLHPRLLPTHIPVVATIHHSVHAAESRAFKSVPQAAYHRFWIAPNERRVLRRASHVVAVSHFVDETAQRTLVDVPTEVIYNGVDTDTFKPDIRQRKPGDPFRLLYVGSWIKRKGVDLLAPIMRELGEAFELRYTGGAAATHDQPGMPPNMHDIGRLQGDDAVVTAMQDADALLFPSRSEGLPLVVIEAMACGMPTIAMRGSSITEVIAGNAVGVLCHPDDVRDFADAVRTIACDAVTYEQLRSQARILACSRFSMDAMITHYMKCYVKLSGDLGYQESCDSTSVEASRRDMT